jgi:pimeloyl-ACP methyl ester carboxylesterase
MEMAYRVSLTPVLAAAALVLIGCEPKPAPPTVPGGTATSADGVAIRYEVAGHGQPALVFVHCWTCNRTFWDGQVAEIARQHQVVTLDLAGHGESGRGRKNYTVETFGADVAAVVDKLGLEQVVLVGHSMGGPVAVEAAKRLGDRVIGVVGVDTFYTGFSAPTEEQKINEMLKPFEQNFVESSANFMGSFFAPGTDPALRERLVKITSAADPAMAINAMRNVIAWYGAKGASELERAASRLRNINGNPKGDGKPLHPSVVLISGAGHFVAQEKPAEFNRTLEAIVTEFAASAKAAAAQTGTR